MVFKTCFGFTLHRWGLTLSWPPSIKSLVNPSLHFKADLHGAICRMRPPYDTLTTRIASCKSTVRLGYVYRTRHEKCRKILKHVLKPHDNRSLKQ